MRIYGVDFTCAPRAAKPITAGVALLKGSVLQLERVERLPTFAQFEALLARPGPWIGGFDFPFSLHERQERREGEAANAHGRREGGEAGERGANHNNNTRVDGALLKNE